MRIELMKRWFLGGLLLALVSATVQAGEPLVTLRLWNGKAPGEKDDIGAEKLLPPRGAKPIQRLSNVTDPTISLYKPAADKDTGAAVLVCPGGGYNILAMDLEGTEVADWLNSIGVTAIVLKYRVPRRKDLPKHQAPLQDAQRAMSLVRANAQQWKIDSQRIGILGFSAGGHLSATASTNFDRRHYEAIDEHDKLSCRPDFMVLVYPAYLLAGTVLAEEIRVSKKTPPTFLVHAGNDGISAENSARFYLALKQAGVAGELHIYANGGHGFGLRPTEFACSSWPKRCEAWLRARGLLAKP
jgi:acetyl esterase/lipase